MNPNIECPECAGALRLPERFEAGEVVDCSDCGVSLEIAAANPISLALAPEVQEDWGE